MTATESAITVLPASEARWEDLQLVFGTRGAASRCQCQRYKQGPRESFASLPAEERAHRLRQQTDCGHRESRMTSGLVADRNGEPVGWVVMRVDLTKEPASHGAEVTAGVEEPHRQSGRA